LLHCSLLHFFNIALLFCWYFYTLCGYIFNFYERVTDPLSIVFLISVNSRIEKDVSFQMNKRI